MGHGFLPYFPDLYSNIRIIALILNVLNLFQIRINFKYFNKQLTSKRVESIYTRKFKLHTFISKKI